MYLQLYVRLPYLNLNTVFELTQQGCTILQIPRVWSAYHRILAFSSHSSWSTDNLSTSRSESHLKALKIEDCKLHNIKVGTFDFLHPVGVFNCGDSGGIYNNSGHNFTIIIPAGAVPNDSVITIEVSVCLYGSFSFPDIHRPVSPILWLHAQVFQFQKAVKVTLQHYIDISEEEDCRSLGLTFMKANCCVKELRKQQKGVQD